MITKLWFALLTSVLLSACTKVERDPTRTELLTDHSWRMDSMTMPVPATTGFSSVVVAYSELPACRTDNTYRFELNGNYVFDDGAASCSGPSQTGTGTWQWLNNETQVVTVLNGVATTWDVAELSSGRIKLVSADGMWRVYVRR